MLASLVMLGIGIAVCIGVGYIVWTQFEDAITVPEDYQERGDTYNLEYDEGYLARTIAIILVASGFVCFVLVDPLKMFKEKENK